MNLPTVIIALIVLGIFMSIVVAGFQKRKRGGGCGCGCAGCPSAGLCHGGGDAHQKDRPKDV